MKKTYRRQSEEFKKEVEDILSSGGKLNWAQVLRCKTRYFTDGFVIGSKQFVESYFQDLKTKTGQYQKRTSGARKMRRVSEDELFTMRDLQKDRFEI